MSHKSLITSCLRHGFRFKHCFAFSWLMLWDFLISYLLFDIFIWPINVFIHIVLSTFFFFLSLCYLSLSPAPSTLIPYSCFLSPFSRLFHHSSLPPFPPPWIISPLTHTRTPLSNHPLLTHYITHYFPHSLASITPHLVSRYTLPQSHPASFSPLQLGSMKHGTRGWLANTKRIDSRNHTIMIYVLCLSSSSSPAFLYSLLVLSGHVSSLCWFVRVSLSIFDSVFTDCTALYSVKWCYMLVLFSKRDRHCFHVFVYMVHFGFVPLSNNVCHCLSVL